MSKKPRKLNVGLQLLEVSPMTDNQQLVFDEYRNNNLLLYGYAGTGKTYLSLYLALNDIISNGLKKKIIIVRSIIPVRDIGFLPGTITEKIQEYEIPYVQICKKLFGVYDAYDQLVQKGIIEFTPTSFLRGTNIDDAIVIVDEFSNMNFQENDSLITRLNDNCKVIYCGDISQSDLKTDKEKVGVMNFISIIKNIKSFKTIEFEINDIVRSGLVKEYLIQKYKFFENK